MVLTQQARSLKNPCCQTMFVRHVMRGNREAAKALHKRMNHPIFAPNFDKDCEIVCQHNERWAMQRNACDAIDPGVAMITGGVSPESSRF